MEFLTVFSVQLFQRSTSVSTTTVVKAPECDGMEHFWEENNTPVSSHSTSQQESSNNTNTVSSDSTTKASFLNLPAPSISKSTPRAYRKRLGDENITIENNMLKVLKVFEEVAQKTITTSPFAQTVTQRLAQLSKANQREAEVRILQVLNEIANKQDLEELGIIVEDT